MEGQVGPLGVKEFWTPQHPSTVIRELIRWVYTGEFRSESLMEHLDSFIDAGAQFQLPGFLAAIQRVLVERELVINGPAIVIRLIMIARLYDVSRSILSLLLIAICTLRMRTI